jgi:hypothetical protein
MATFLNHIEEKDGEEEEEEEEEAKFCSVEEISIKIDAVDCYHRYHILCFIVY